MRAEHGAGRRARGRGAVLAALPVLAEVRSVRRGAATDAGGERCVIGAGRETVRRPRSWFAVLAVLLAQVASATQGAATDASAGRSVTGAGRDPTIRPRGWCAVLAVLVAQIASIRGGAATDAGAGGCVIGGGRDPGGRSGGWIAILAVPLGMLPLPALAQVSSVYLVQDSGWMEPFYTDPSSQFRPLVKALIAASDAGGETVVARFDQDGQVPGRRSPDVVYRGPDDASAIGRALDAIEPAVQRNGHLADADFDGALVGGVQSILAGKPGIVWMITNNRNSPGNSQRVSENTRDFATRLESSPVLPTVVSYPVRMVVHGKLYDANGLILYGIAYGKTASAELDRLTHAAPLRALFADPAVQLKPLDQAKLAFEPMRSDTLGLRVSRAPENGLVFDGVPGGRASTVSIEGALRSDFFPHVIDRARLSLRWLPPETGGPALDAGIAPDTLTGLQPGQSQDGIVLSLHVPRIARAPGLAGLLQKDLVLHGTLRIDLTGVGLSLSDGFRTKMAQIAALDQLPDVFFADRNVASASTTLPVTLVVRFSAWPLLLALGGIGLLVLLAALVLALLLATRQHEVVLAGQVRRVRLRPFERRLVLLPGGRAFSVRGRVLGPPRIVERTAPETR